MATTVRAAARVPMPIGEAWQRLRDLRLAKEYVPGLTDSIITTDQTEGIGTSRLVSNPQIGDMNETVVVWDEGQGFTIRLHKGEGPARPFKEAHFRYQLREGPSPDACEIHTALIYELPAGAFGRVVDALFLRRIFQRNVLDTAVCLAENYRTRAPVDFTRLAELRKNGL